MTAVSTGTWPGTSILHQHLFDRHWQQGHRLTRQNQQLAQHPKSLQQQRHRIRAGRRSHDQRRSPQLLQLLARIAFAGIDVLTRAQLPREGFLLRVARQGHDAVAEAACVLDGEVAEAAETLDRDRGSGGDVHVADGIEAGHAGAEDGCVFRGVDVGGGADGGFGAKDAVFGVYEAC